MCFDGGVGGLQWTGTGREEGEDERGEKEGNKKNRKMKKLCICVYMCVRVSWEGVAGTHYTSVWTLSGSPMAVFSIIIFPVSFPLNTDTKIYEEIQSKFSKSLVLS